MFVGRYRVRLGLEMWNREWAADYLPLFAARIAARLGKDAHVRPDAATQQYIVAALMYHQSEDEAAKSAQAAATAFLDRYNGWDTWDDVATESTLLDEEQAV